MTSRSHAASRLSTGAAVLRLAVEVGLKAIRYKKTVKALLDHIIKTLPSPEDHFLEPITQDYIKIFRTVLEYQPHAEHIEAEQWTALVLFCDDGIGFYTEPPEEASSQQSLVVRNGSSHQASRASRSATPSSISESIGPPRKAAPKGGLKDVGKNIDELVLCLSHLISIPHAQLLEVSQTTLESLFAFLQGTMPQNRPLSQEAAFSCIGSILFAASTENIILATWTLKKAIPHVRRLWHPKMHQALREGLLVILLYGECLLPRLLRDDDDDENRIELQRLLEVIHAEYVEKSERELLSIDDLELLVNQPSDQNMIFSNMSFRLRTGNSRSESSWALLHSISKIFNTLHYLSSPRSHSARDAVETPKKRRKVDEPIGELLEHFPRSHGAARAATLQYLTFMIVEVKLKKTNLRRLLDFLVPLVTSESISVSTWATLALSCLVQQDLAASFDVPGTWLQIFKLMSRNITSLSSCRPACHLMSILLSSKLVQVSDVADVISVLFNSVDLDGPAAFTDSAMTLWTILISLRGIHNPSLVYESSEKIMRWFFVRWKPCTLPS